jgi:putative ABC transport system ATP-binding protein
MKQAIAETVSYRSAAPDGLRPPVIQLESVRKIYRAGEVEVHALGGVSLEIQSGEFVAVMGPSGSGKSTMLNLVGCLDRVSDGRYFLDGVDVSGMSKDELADIRNQKIGFVFQSFNLISRTSVLDNVELPMVYRGLPVPERRQRARMALAAVGLSDKEQSFPNQLSGGQQQRVALARALVNDPTIILADEPTGALDTSTAKEIMTILQQLNRERRITIVLVTHELDIAAYGNRLVRFRDGMIEEDRSADDPIQRKEVFS